MQLGAPDRSAYSRRHAHPGPGDRFRRADRPAHLHWCFDSAQFPKPETVEISDAEINAALHGTSTLDFRDAIGHGTATAGLAAGNGSALASRKYIGVAPEADLLIVKQTSEGAPAHGDQAEEKQFNACFDDAVDWVAQKMDALNQPGVVIWNSGTQWGPVDGSSAISRKINAVFGPDKPGRIWVATSGDEGGLPNHAGADYSASAPATISFKITAALTYPTAWYSGDAPASVTIELSDGTKVGPVAAESNINQGGVQLVQYQPGKEFYPWTSDSGARAVWMRIEGHSGQTGTITFQGADRAGHVDVYGDVLGAKPLTSATEFTDSLVDGRINDPSSTNGVIVVGNYVALEGFTAMDGSNPDFSAEGKVGDLWIKSSGGPTRDGRMVVDIAAAGQGVPASLSATSWWSTLTGLQPKDGEGKYIRFGGTSAAGPIALGTIALMLEVNPTLTTEQVRQILRDTATSDDFTGSTPNADWGYGKLNIAEAVAAAGRVAGP